MAAAEPGGAQDRAPDVFARPLDRFLDPEPLRQAGGDRRGQRAAGAVSVAGVDPRALPNAEPSGACEDVVHRAAGEVAAFEQRRAAAEAEQLPGRIAHRGEAVDRAAEEDL